MKLKGIILTGTSGAGKSSIANGLVSWDEKFGVVKALTTRSKRDDDEVHYIYIDDLNFESFRKTFYTSTKYRGKNYAITIPEIEQMVEANKIPILVIGPQSFSEISDEKRKEFLSFFIDAEDSLLEERLSSRDGKEITKEIREQRTTDRQYSDCPDYIIQNKCLDDAIAVVVRLIELYNVGTLLSEKDINLLIANGMLVNGAERRNIKGASYDLRLGDEFYYSGEIKKLEKYNLRLTIEPYDYAIVSSKEEICLPKDVAAHFGLTVGLFCQGIILSNGQQVDPGFRGTLFCLLFNTSNRPVTIKKSEHYATIEFTKMNNFASKYKGKYQEKKDIIDVIPPNAMQGAINELKKEIEELKYESRSMQNIYIGVISIIIAAISILLILN